MAVLFTTDTMKGTVLVSVDRPERPTRDSFAGHAMTGTAAKSRLPTFSKRGKSMNRSPLHRQIDDLHTQIEERLGEVNGVDGIYASKEEVRALRLLCGLLQSMFGMFANVDFD
jgi:hypothetical protein